MIHRFITGKVLCVALCALPVSLSSHLLANTQSDLKDGLAITGQAHEESIQSQKRVDSLSDKAQQAINDYLDNSRQADITEAYNAQLRRLIDSQKAELSDLRTQIESIDKTEQSMLPMLNVMVAQLAEFVDADLPFLVDERAKRIQKLSTLLDRADVSVAEKYRRILEAYTVEVDYGRTIEAYSAKLINASDEQHVNYLRFGRVALYFQTLNGSSGGLWLPATSQWQALSADENLTLGKALQIAQQQRVPELISLPVPADTAKP